MLSQFQLFMISLEYVFIMCFRKYMRILPQLGKRIKNVVTVSVVYDIRLRAKKGPAPPLGNFADISYLEENFKPHLLRDVCTPCSGELVSDSLLHMLL